MAPILTVIITIIILMIVFLSLRNEWKWINIVPTIRNLPLSVLIAWFPFIIGITLTLNGINIEGTIWLLLWAVFCVITFTIGHTSGLSIIKRR